MYPRLFHIYGPFFLQSYGLCIALGIAVFAWLFYNDSERRNLMNDDQFHWLLIMGIISGVLGGRLLFFLTAQEPFSFGEFFEFWYGGFAVLGSVVGILLVIPWLLQKYSIPILPFLDRVALYSPLMQSISRVGCFLAGCCYGKHTTALWAVKYTNKDCMAPLGIFLHPTQLYSALLLLCIFLSLLYLQKYVKGKGNLLALYLLLMGFERFFIDFFRNDQSYFFKSFLLFSDHQVIALTIMVCATIFLCVRSFERKLGSKAQ